MNKAMGSLLKSDDTTSVEEYLEGEKSSKLRHEYLNGVVYAMAGGTLNHNRITLNIGSALDDWLAGSNCRPFVSDVKVKVQTLASESYYYPDVVVTCAADDTNDLFLENPTTIFEVLSDSTERIDRQEKFLAYRSLESLQEYILVSQDRREVTVARKRDNWQSVRLTGGDFELELSCTDQLLGSARIYRNVDLPR